MKWIVGKLIALMMLAALLVCTGCMEGGYTLEKMPTGKERLARDQQALAFTQLMLKQWKEHGARDDSPDVKTLKRQIVEYQQDIQRTEQLLKQQKPTRDPFFDLCKNGVVCNQ